jgi:hypothetical protein
MIRCSFIETPQSVFLRSSVWASSAFGSRARTNRASIDAWFDSSLASRVALASRDSEAVPGAVSSCISPTGTEVDFCLVDSAASCDCDVHGGLDEPEQLPLPAGVAIDVTLRRLDGAMSGKELNVAKTATRPVNVSGGDGNEAASTRVRRTSFKTQFGEHNREPIDDAIGSQIRTAIRADHWPDWL